MKINANDFHELIDHEFDDAKVTIIAKGYRVDNKKGGGYRGLKVECGLSECKSVDYLVDEQREAGCISFVEFSDIARQISVCLEVISMLKALKLKEDASEEDKSKWLSFRRTLIQSKYREAHAEIMSKLKDTYSMYRTSFPSLVDNLPGEGHAALSALLVHNGVDHLEVGQKIEVARLLSQIKSNVLTGLPKNYFRSFKVETLERFCGAKS